MQVTIHQIANLGWTLIWIWRVILISRFGSVQCHAICMNNHIFFLLNSTDVCCFCYNSFQYWCGSWWQWLFVKRTNPSLLCRVVRGCKIYLGFCEARRASHCHSPQTTYSSKSTCCAISAQNSAMHVVVYAGRLTSQRSIFEIINW